MNKKLLIAVAAIAIIAIIVYLSVKKEFYQEHTGVPVDIPDGVYNILNRNNKPLASTAVTPIQCKDYLFQHAVPSKATAWRVQRVAHGVVMLKKPDDKECMYTSPDSSIRSYVINGSCNSKNVCGMTEPTSTGELDERSLHTYFMILQNPGGKHYIKSMSNDMYLSMDDSLKLVSEPDDSSLFTFEMAQ
jgi:hypothetical protein